MKLTPLLAAAFLMIVPFAPQAHACAIAPVLDLPLEGISLNALARWERDADKRQLRYARARQASAWNDAETVFVARIVRSEMIEMGVSPRRSYKLPRVDLRPVQWLKGQGATTDFAIAATSNSDCGYEPHWPVFLESGSEVVVFAKSSRASGDWIGDVILPVELVDPRGLRVMKTAAKLP
jgi:hypothetical protein